MRPLLALAVGTLVVVISGCALMGPPLEERAALNTALVDAPSDAAINNAILAQHTLFGYHFVTNGATLNRLGQHDLAVLAANLKERPGPLNVRRGDAPAKLYEARVKEATRLLVEAGVDRDRITIADGLPGGDGMDSERVLVIIEPGQAQAPQKMRTPAPSMPSVR